MNHNNQYNMLEKKEINKKKEAALIQAQVEKFLATGGSIVEVAAASNVEEVKASVLQALRKQELNYEHL
jgi:hypothetical protein